MITLCFELLNFTYKNYHISSIVLKAYIHKNFFYPSGNNFTQALLEMLDKTIIAVNKDAEQNSDQFIDSKKNNFLMRLDYFCQFPRVVS